MLVRALQKCFWCLSAAFLFGMTFFSPSSASAQMDSAALSRALQSVGVITVETRTGSKVTGLAFLAAGENKAVTTLHLLKIC